MEAARGGYGEGRITSNRRCEGEGRITSYLRREGEGRITSYLRGEGGSGHWHPPRRRPNVSIGETGGGTFLISSICCSRTWVRVRVGVRVRVRVGVGVRVSVARCS